MTSPRHRFGAHYCGSPFFTYFDELIQGLLKFWCLHVIGKAAEACISPTSIDRIATRMPQATECSHMLVIDPHLLQRAR
jgi:hypothetical protein